MVELLYCGINFNDMKIEYTIASGDNVVGEIGIILKSDFLKEDYGIYINEITVKVYPEYRNKGYAKMAIEILVYSHRTIELWSVIKTDNFESLACHKKLNSDEQRIYEKNNELYKCYIFNKR